MTFKHTYIKKCMSIICSELKCQISIGKIETRRIAKHEDCQRIMALDGTLLQFSVVLLVKHAPEHHLDVVECQSSRLLGTQASLGYS